MSTLRILFCLSAFILNVGSTANNNMNPGAMRELEKAGNDGMALVQKGNYGAAAAIFETAARRAHQIHADAMESRLLLSAGNCHAIQFRFRPAMERYLAARTLARKSGNLELSGYVLTAISVMHYQWRDVPAAMEAARQAYREVGRRAGSARFLPYLALQLSKFKEDGGDIPGAVDLDRFALDLAEIQGQEASAMMAWSSLGHHLLQQKRLDEAETATVNAFRLSKSQRQADQCLCYTNLGVLRQAQGRLPEALLLTGRAIECMRAYGTAVAPSFFYHDRALARLEAGQLEAGLDDLRTSLATLRHWRLEILPSDSALRGAEESLQQGYRNVYGDFIRAAAESYFDSHRPALLRESFEAAEENRAASLRHRASESGDHLRMLPDQYWDKLQQLRRAEISALRSGKPAPETESLHVSLAEMEAQAGIRSRVVRETGADMESTRRALLPEEALLTFHLAPGRSYLWAITKESTAMFRLPPEEAIQALVGRARNSLERDRPDSSSHELYQLLFSQLPDDIARKTVWTLVPDGALLTAPFSALAVESGAGGPVYLIETHAIRSIPSAYLLAESNHVALDGSFVGFGDPIFNAADSRYHPSRRPSWLAGILPGPAATGLELPRLAGSGPEIKECAAAWGGSSRVLTGAEASRSGLAAALGAIQTAGSMPPQGTLGPPPAIAHFATHVLAPPGRTDQAAVALGLDANGTPDFLTLADIAGFRRVPQLVTLSGCSSGDGKAVPGTGLIGLTRAWLLSGAHAVIATYWPTSDDSGELLARFYRNLRAGREPGWTARSAFALRAAQIEMIHSGSWRSRPRYWGAYFLVAGG